MEASLLALAKSICWLLRGQAEGTGMMFKCKINLTAK